MIGTPVAVKIGAGADWVRAIVSRFVNLMLRKRNVPFVHVSVRRQIEQEGWNFQRRCWTRPGWNQMLDASFAGTAKILRRQSLQMSRRRSKEDIYQQLSRLIRPVGVSLSMAWPLRGWAGQLLVESRRAVHRRQAFRLDEVVHYSSRRSPWEVFW